MPGQDAGVFRQPGLSKWLFFRTEMKTNLSFGSISIGSPN